MRFTKDHEWVELEGDVATVGVTAYAAAQLGDIVFVELPDEGDRVASKEAFGTIEAVKAVNELFAPVTGEVVEVNLELDSNPQLVNSEPYDGGWMIRIRLENPEELKALLSAADYEKHVT